MILLSLCDATSAIRIGTNTHSGADVRFLPAIFSAMFRLAFPALLMGILATLSSADAESLQTVAIGQLLQSATLQGLNGPTSSISSVSRLTMIVRKR